MTKTFMGDFGMDQEMWLLQLWSGTIGAALSAVLAALVAVGVVLSSNKVQRGIAAEALAENTRQSEEQTSIIREQLEEQRKQGEAQLASVREQLYEQRKEASKAREYAAIADLVGLTAVGRDIQREEDFFIEYEQKLLAAAARWQLELAPAEAMRTEIGKWAPFLTNLARGSHGAGLTIDPGTLEVDPNSDMERRQDLVKNFASLLVEWPRATTKDERAHIVGMLARVRKAGSGPLEDDVIFAGWL
jgi:hypothetical protein